MDRYLDFEILLYQLNDDYFYLKFDQMEKAVYDFKHYIDGNQESLCNYGENWRKGKIISSAFICRIAGQSANQQAICQKAADAMDSKRLSFAASNESENSQW